MDIHERPLPLAAHPGRNRLDRDAVLLQLGQRPVRRRPWTARPKKKVVPELMPRALFWFRWGAAWTWITGVLLLLLVFYHGGIMFDGEPAAGAPGDRDGRCSSSSRPFIYDALAQERPGQGSRRSFGAVALRAGRGGRGADGPGGPASATARSPSTSARMFGTIMAFNVWFRIWPAQQKIITAVKNGHGARRRARGARRHALAPQRLHVGAAGVDDDQPAHDDVAAAAWAARRLRRSSMPLVVILVGWHLVWQLYKRAPKVKGF